jgi:uncharacterized protein YwqG
VPDPGAVDGVAPAPEDLDPDARLPRRAIRFEPTSLPPPWELAPLADDLPDVDEDALFDALEELREAEYASAPKHQMAGFADPVQGAEMELECQLVTNGLYCGDPSGFRDPRAEALKAGASDWRLLLQVDSDDDLGVMWGDLGRIYFWVREQDARRGDFSGVWLILQCS